MCLRLRTFRKVLETDLINYEYVISTSSVHAFYDTFLVKQFDMPLGLPDVFNGLPFCFSSVWCLQGVKLGPLVGCHDLHD